MKKILVPCDFRTPAINAFRFALDIAEKSSDSTVHVLHVVEKPDSNDSILMPVLVAEKELLQNLKEEAELGFVNLEQRYNKHLLNVISKIQFGNIGDVIQQYAQDHEIDVIIMGSHGANGFKEFFIGSNAEKVVRNAIVPVLVLKDYYIGAIKNIIFPYTLATDSQEELVEKVKELQHFLNAHLWIVWINTPLNFTPDTIIHKRLNDFAQRFQFKDYTISVFNHLSIEEGILGFTDEIDAPLIAMGTHGRRGISRLMHGSITESLVNHTQKMVWSYVMKEEAVEA